MHLLYICHAPPCPPALGPARRHYQLLREMLKHHEVTLVSFGTAADERVFHQHFPGACREAVFVDMSRSRPIKALHRSWLMLTARADLRRLYAARFQRAIDAVASRGRFDVVMLSTQMLARYRLPAAPTLGDAHNVEYEVCCRAASEAPALVRRLYYRVQGELTRREESVCASRLQFISATSARDGQQFVRWLRAERIFVVPNGVDVAAFARSGADGAPGPPTVLFTGLMSYYPNAHAAERLCNELLPRIAARSPDVRLVIAGARPSPRLARVRDRRVLVTGRVDDIRPWLWSATVFAMPLTIGGGTRVKALEAMAARLPIVSTSLGCEGLDLVDERHALIRDDPAAFADAVSVLLHDRALRRRLTDAAFDLVAEKFDLPVIGRAIDRALAATATSSLSGAMPS